MKKFLFLASATTLLLGSCADDLSLRNPNMVEGKSKIYATFNYGEPSTRLGYDSSDNSYVWQTGDAMGVFGTAGSYVSNAMFTFVEGSGNGFTGQVELPVGSYYAYYPYAQGTPFNQTAFEMSIEPIQTFNSIDCQQFTIPTESNANANGSFAQGEAPAIATGSIAAGDEENQLTLAFSPQAAYIVIPATGYGTVNSARLTMTKAGTEEGTTQYQQLNGTITVNFNEPNATPELTLSQNMGSGSTEGIYTVQEGETIDFNSNPEYQITLNCGKGVKLDLTNPVNFWFIVPAGIELQGWNVNLTFNPGDENLEATDTRQLSSTYASANGGLITRNEVRQIWKNVVAEPFSVTPYYYNPTNSTFINDPYMFLEYANLVTNGNQKSFVTNWNALTAEEQEKSYLRLMLSSKAFTVAENGSVTLNEGLAGNLDEYLCKGLVSETLELAPSTINVGTPGTEYFPSNVPAYFSYLEDYTKGEMGPIGGAVTYYLSAMEGASLDNLTIAGNGIFAGNNNNEAVANISDLTLNNAVLNAQGVAVPSNGYGYYLLCQQPKINSNKPTVVLSGITVTGESTAINQTTEGEYPTALFDAISAQYLNGNNNPLFVVNETSLNFANYLNVNQGMDFNKYVDEDGEPVLAPTSFGTINTTLKDGNKITVLNENDAIYVIDTINKNDNHKGYSVYAPDANNVLTSYWTGGAFATAAPGSAELLAYYAQTPSLVGNQSFNMTNNLNLMGNYSATINGKEIEGNNYWFATASNNDALKKSVTISGTAEYYKISNIYIATTTDGENQMNSSDYSQTLLGWYGAVKGVEGSPVLIDQFTIDNTVGKPVVNPIIAAIGVAPVTGVTNNVVVTGYSVNSATGYEYQKNQIFGGLYLLNGSSNYTLCADSSLEFEPEPTTTDAKYGTKAGCLNYGITIPATSSLKDITNVTLPSNANGEYGLLSIGITLPEKDDVDGLFAPYIKINVASTDNLIFTNVTGEGLITPSSDMPIMIQFTDSTNWIPYIYSNGYYVKLNN